MDQINIFALGGQDENGKNCYVLEHNDNIFIINSGVKVPINSNNGVDTLIPNFSYLSKHKKRVKGIFITDVKNESFSALPWLVMAIPGIKIYASSFNKFIIAERLKKYKIESSMYSIEVINKPISFGSLTVHPIPLAGTLPESLGYNFQTPSGSYLFMFNFVEGNLGYYGSLDYKKLAQNLRGSRINALIVDAGKSNAQGRAIDRLELPKHILDIFKDTPQEERIIVGAYYEDMVMLQQILKQAILNNRPVCAYGKTYGQLLSLIAKTTPNFKLPQMIDYRDLNKHKNAVILVTGSLERLFLRFVRIVTKKDVYLKIKPKDTVIMLAAPINGLESYAAATLDLIAKITPKIVDISEGVFYKHHPTREDLMELVKVLKPKYFIPAQGLYRYLVDVANLINNDADLSKHTKTLILMNGKIAHFIDDKLFSQNGKIAEVGDTIIDGFGIGDISSEVIAEREALGREGVVLINGRYSSKTKKIVGKLHIEFCGVIDPMDEAEIADLIKRVIIETLKTKDFANMREVNEKLRKTIRKKIFKVTDKDPMVVLGLIHEQTKNN
ncbi:MBL fold metallo-hydrolase RNA specificity domain-containing protein [Mycoplasmopsis sturni]|uniref:MBL fold metallo-hydrolase RNA specificity domain-containing protein n=1 Tax=Mycoplasmopsis sturni TaxID=39047 RepID=UPI00055E462C|nr:ribonuclease J [Mycoplasmopsis sturni]